jgi:hypothetical protein
MKAANYAEICSLYIFNKVNEGEQQSKLYEDEKSDVECLYRVGSLMEVAEGVSNYVRFSGRT